MDATVTEMVIVIGIVIVFVISDVNRAVQLVVMTMGIRRPGTRRVCHAFEPGKEKSGKDRDDDRPVHCDR
jgi:hypothetical protein